MKPCPTCRKLQSKWIHDGDMLNSGKKRKKFLYSAKTRLSPLPISPIRLVIPVAPTRIHAEKRCDLYPTSKNPSENPRSSSSGTGTSPNPVEIHPVWAIDSR